MSNERFVTVEIVNTPPGEAPEAIRKAWVGCQMTGLICSHGVNTGVISGETNNVGVKQFVVSFEQALVALFVHGKEEAGNWWIDLCRSKEGTGKEHLSFDQGCFRELETAGIQN